jgi:membrane complex biogenesis BtpA family protein
MSWLKDILKTNKPIIAMCHLQAMPGDPDYNRVNGMKNLLENARHDLHALQNGGVDAIMFSNEFSLPYMTTVGAETTATMARVIGELMSEISIPFGVNVLWDPKASIDLAAATGAKFVREIFTGVYSSDFGLWNTNSGDVIRHRSHIGADDVKLLFNIVPEAAKYIGDRSIVDIARSTIFNCKPDALCVSGLTAGAETNTQTLEIVSSVAGDTPVFANTGVRLENVEEQLTIASGAVVGTTFKFDAKFNNPVDESRVKAFMTKVKEFRRNFA